MSDLSPRLTAYLESWYATSTARKTDAGVQVELTFSQFVSLFTAKQITTLEKAIEAKRLRYFMDAKNPYAFVLTWRSYAARQTDVFSVTTAQVCSRLKSKADSRVKKGETLSSRTRARISEGKRGKPIDKQHKANISNALKDRPKQPWTEERRAARRAQIAQKKEK